MEFEPRKPQPHRQGINGPSRSKTQDAKASPRTEAQKAAERERLERSAANAKAHRARWDERGTDPAVQAQLEAAQAAGIEPDLWQIYGMMPPAEVWSEQRMRIASAEAQRRAELKKSDPDAYAKLIEQESAQAEAARRAAYEESRNGFAFVPPKRLAQSPVDTKAAERARQRAEDKANGIIHPSDPDAVIQYVSGESVVLSPQEREQALKSGLLPPIFGELREWADELRADKVQPSVPGTLTGLSPTAQAPQEPVQLAQAMPMGPALPAPPLPGVPFPANQWPFPNIFRNKNPLTGQPTQTEEERKAVQNLTPNQIKGLQNSSLKDNIPYAATSFKQNQCTFIDVAVGNGGPVHSMMTEALTGALNPTMVVTPGGSAALFDGQYRADLARLEQRKGQLFEVESIVPPTNVAQMKAAQAFVRSKLPEWERQAAIAHSCGTSLRVALPDQELAAWANQQLKGKVPGLAITEGKWGGTYGQVRADTVGGEVHHVPSNNVTRETTNLGSAIWMTIGDHKKTASNGSADAAKIYRQRQQRLINSGHYDQAQQEDIQDIRRIGRGLYDVPSLQMLKTRKRNLLNGTHKP